MNKGDFVVQNAKVVYNATLHKDFDWNLYILILLTVLIIGFSIASIIIFRKMETDLSEAERKVEILERKLEHMNRKEFKK